MAITQQEVALHQLKAADIKGFITAIAPLAECKDERVRKLVIEKLEELIPQCKVFIESPVKTVI